MAFLGSIFGNNGGGAFQATQAPVSNDTSAAQAGGSLANQQALATQLGGSVQGQQLSAAQQQALASQLAGLNGVGNLGSAYGAQQNLTNALAGQNGIGNQSNVFNQQQALSNQLGQIASGQGPNPAQAALAANTGNNIASQASLMAGQRGSGANAGLLARQAAQQGAATQQQAVGQGATLQANQSLSALQQQAAQQQALQQAATQQVSQQTGAQNQLANLANQQVGLQQSQNLASANQANVLGGQQLAQQNAATAAQQNQLNTGNQNLIASQSNANSVNGGIQQQVAQQQGGLLNGVVSGIGTALGAVAGLAKGGEVKKTAQKTMDYSMGNQMPAFYAAGGPVTSNANLKENYDGPQSMIGKHLVGYAKGGQTKKVDALLSPGEKVLNPKEAKMAKGGKLDPMKHAKTVPGTPVVGGAKNSYANDIVPAKLKPGSIVLPRTVTQSSNPSEAAHRFVAALKSKKGK